MFISDSLLGGEEKDFQLFVTSEGIISGYEDKFILEHSPPAASAAADTAEMKTTEAIPDDINSSNNADTPQGPINEETGEINWDCPCLKGALEPPCGDFFKSAFSCFVGSKAEPKGSDCLELFSAMQDCYRAHPDIYMKAPEDDDISAAEEQLLEAPQI